MSHLPRFFPPAPFCRRASSRHPCTNGFRALGELASQLLLDNLSAARVDVLRQQQLQQQQQAAAALGSGSGLGVRADEEEEPERPLPPPLLPGNYDAESSL